VGSCDHIPREWERDETGLQNPGASRRQNRAAAGRLGGESPEARRAQAHFLRPCDSSTMKSKVAAPDVGRLPERRAHAQATAAGNWIQLYSYAGNGLQVGTLNARPLVLGTNNTRRMEIGAAGGVTVVGNFTATGTKSFAAVDPADSKRAIYFAALEGPEAGTYFRGTARLKDGEAVIELPGYFTRVTEPQRLTVPASASSSSTSWCRASARAISTSRSSGPTICLSRGRCRSRNVTVRARNGSRNVPSGGRSEGAEGECP
jgi:hypothetical protein